jgi:Mg-chelatase subunit ChlD
MRQHSWIGCSLRRGALGLALLAPMLLTAAQPEPQEHAAALLVVLDVSGSMKESVAGGEKRGLAQRGLLHTLETVSTDTVVGLRLLGQGPTGDDCTATTAAVEFGPFDRSTWETALATVRWDGATPLVYSMREALKSLREVDAVRKEILLIGDGEETCGEDPVGVARAEASDVPIHTISLGERVSHQLAGIALVTGGTYTRAFDETSFGLATNSVVSDIPGNLMATVETPLATGSANWLDVIIDVSNSMWGQINGHAKVELAREALQEAMSDLPPTVAVGLRAYGHRVSVEDKEAGCADTEQLLPPRPGNGATIVDIVNELVPRGQTPIARSLQEAAADLREAGGTGTILLVSDGVESCGGDPVAVASEFRASGLNVVLHTVGLGVTAEEAETLTALASAGGGTFFNAPTASELLVGINTAVRSTSEFILQRDPLNQFPRNVLRVRGGDSASESEVLELGTYSFVDHLFREQRYFAVPGQPGEMITLSGMVCALAVTRNRRTGIIGYQGSTNMMFGHGVTAAGDNVPRTSLTVRGDMGEWKETQLPVGSDGLARFWFGRSQGAVHRDMIFRVSR